MPGWDDAEGWLDENWEQLDKGDWYFNYEGEVDEHGSLREGESTDGTLYIWEGDYDDNGEKIWVEYEMGQYDWDRLSDWEDDHDAPDAEYWYHQ